MKILLIILGVISLFVAWFIVGGLNLDYLRANGITKATEYCDKDTKVVYEGYQRSIFMGFGGKVWYMCNINGSAFTFFITQRVNNRELQVYNPTPLQKVPSSFTIN